MFPRDLDRHVYLLKIVIIRPLLRHTHVFFLTQAPILHDGSHQRAGISALRPYIAAPMSPLRPAKDAP